MNLTLMRSDCLPLLRFEEMNSGLLQRPDAHHDEVVLKKKKLGTLKSAAPFQMTMRLLLFGARFDLMKQANETGGMTRRRN